MSSSSLLLHQMLIVFLLFCLSKASGGTCLSYGHSCWGGHGKRNGGGHMGPSSQKHTSGWYLSKLFDTPAGNSKSIEDIFKSQNLNPEELNNFRRSGYQQYPESDTERNVVSSVHRREKENSDADSKHNKWDSEMDESDEEIMVLTPDVQRLPVSKFRLYQIMNQESNKPRNEY